MRRRWHIRTRVLLTLIGLTAAVLLTVGLTFNLSVRGFIRSRVTAQLDSVSESASYDRRGSLQEQPQPQPEKRLEGRPDRIMGTTGSAAVLNKNGALVFPMHGDEETAAAIADYFRVHGFDGSRRYRILSIGSEKYAVSVADDPIQKDCFLVSYVDVTAILAFTARINTVLLIIILATILLSVLLSRRFAKSFAEPVQELSVFAREIGSGNLNAQEFRFQDVEFESLAESMNRMVSELSEAKQKQEIFFQNVSHELRTPLTSIRGNAEGIVYGLMEPRNAAKVILSESDQLGGMVEDILYLSRMGKAAPEGTAEAADLREVLSLCVSEQRAEAERKGLTFTYDFDEAPVLLPVREQDAQRLFGNLISNAIRYAESRITLQCRREESCVFVSVADDGPGIAEEDLPHIFERFYKGRGGKHGIGLAIAQSVAESCHGSITAHNDGGAVFELRFPAAE
ncbi:MAG: HAMP domain-containing histidine kinase [Oscillospiraceae bacterium]|nr:HAMP domain-containing histidine kinase [Oscillospiraceae bacterium]